MTAAAPVDPSVVVDRLRAAGCVFAEDEAAMLIAEAATPPELERMIAERVAGLPLEIIVGFAEFCGRRILVEPGVFVPRRRTEFLVEQAAALVTPEAVVLDLCCGVGAVGAVLLADHRGIELFAADIEAAAVRSARRNIEPLGGTVFEGDLYDPLPADLRGRVDILTANAPYVPTAEIRLMPPEARLYEPPITLDGGSDGLDLHRRIADDAPNWLSPGGRLLIETSERQSPITVEIFEQAGLATRVARSEELDATVVIGTLRQSV
jgi:release factor glutamine methyltransferase